jgi:uncharacterized protein DUF5329
MPRLLPFFLAMVIAAIAAPVDEIEALLHYVGGLQGATFIRNGSEYPPAAAEAHLRLKWSNQKKRVQTAEDFIRLCATKSSMSGDPYLIRFAGGREEPAAAVLTRQLAVQRSHAVSSESAPTR